MGGWVGWNGTLGALKGAKELFWMYDPKVEKGLVSKA